MVSIKLKFRPSAVVGKEERLYYQVICSRVIRQISTSYRISPCEWNPKTETIEIEQKSNRRLHLESIKSATQNDINQLRNIVHKFTISEVSFCADMIVAEFKRSRFNVTIFDYMERIIIRYWNQGQYRTSETYLATLNSFRKFCNGVNIYMNDITSELMESYECYLRRNQLSPNTISFYIKHLRAIYNRAIEDNLIVDRKPFRRVSTSIEKTTKRALPLRIIKRLKALDCSLRPSRRFAKDMFLFSFYTRGMSFVDIANLQKKNLRGDILFYRRKKTNQKLSIHWEPCMQEILKAYGADTTSTYLFSIINESKDNPRKQYQNMLSLINRHLKEIGKELGLQQPLTMYCARHSWASIARDKGIPISVISEGMGHDSEKTTQIYLASLKSEVIDNANRKILNML